jgi:hypothetical protein
MNNDSLLTTILGTMELIAILNIKPGRIFDEPGEYEYDYTDGIDPWEDEERDMELAEEPGCPYESECYGYYDVCKEHLCNQVDINTVDDEICSPDAPAMTTWLMHWYDRQDAIIGEQTTRKIA